MSKDLFGGLIGPLQSPRRIAARSISRLARSNAIHKTGPFVRLALSVAIFVFADGARRIHAGMLFAVVGVVMVNARRDGSEETHCEVVLRCVSESFFAGVLF